jgi:type IV pilus assembly protein PilC
MSTVKPFDLMQFLQQFRLLLQSGKPLDRSLEIMSRHWQDPRFADHLRSGAERVRGGASLPEALFPPGHPFPSSLERIFRSMPDRDLDLKATLHKLEEAYQALNHAPDRASFPAEILLGGMLFIAVMLGLFVIVVPMLAGMFAESGQALPLPTRIVIAISSLFLSIWPVVLISATGGLYALSRSIKNKRLREIAIVQSFSLLAGQLRTGADLRQALAWASDSVEDHATRSALRAVLSSLSNGSALSAALEQTRFFPPVVAQAVTLGEKKGSLAAPMEELDAYLRNRFDLMTRVKSGLMQPCLLIAVGFTLGFVIMAMYMPIFQMGSVL